MVNYHSFNYSFNLTPKHALWITFGCYLTVKTLFKQNQEENNIRNIFQANYKDIAQESQEKMQKAFSGFVHQKGYPDRGDGIFSQSLNDVSKKQLSEVVERKYDMQRQFNLFAPAYLIGGLSYPLLALISGLFWYYYTDPKFSQLKVQSQKMQVNQYFFNEFNSGLTSIYSIAIASSLKLILTL